MDRKEQILIPVWFLEHIENTLRIQNNINVDKETGETCQDRNIRQALNGVRKLLSSDELTGAERLEPLKPYDAEKDLALTWEDMAKIDAIILDVNNEFAVDYSKEISRQKFYEEVLKRFNEIRKK